MTAVLPRPNGARVTSTCPSCGCIQPDGVLCTDDTAALVSMLAAVPQLLAQLEVAVSKQAKVGGGGKAGKGTAHLKDPVNWGVVAVRDALLVELAAWGDDVLAIRKHPDAGRAVARIGRAVKDSYRAIDRLQDRTYLGQCLYEEDGATCHAEIWANPGAHQVKCSQCEITHDVYERRAWLLKRAEDMLFSVREAAQMLGDVGGIWVTESAIRGYLHRKRISYKTGTTIRLGDLLAVVLDEGERRSA